MATPLQAYYCIAHIRPPSTANEYYDLWRCPHLIVHSYVNSYCWSVKTFCAAFLINAAKWDSLSNNNNKKHFPLEISATLLRNCMFSAGGTQSETLQEPQSSPLTQTN
jgi:hypothetical protein